MWNLPPAPNSTTAFPVHPDPISILLWRGQENWLFCLVVRSPVEFSKREGAWVALVDGGVSEICVTSVRVK